MNFSYGWHSAYVPFFSQSNKQNNFKMTVNLRLQCQGEKKKKSSKLAVSIRKDFFSTRVRNN